MRRTVIFLLALLTMIGIPTVVLAQGGQMESSRGVAGGGITVPGWTGKIDAKEQANGMTINSAKLAKEGDALHIVTGPAVTYWNPANKASGDYTVSATFKEPKYMNLNNHPHPYGVKIAGNSRLRRAVNERRQHVDEDGGCARVDPQAGARVEDQRVEDVAARTKDQAAVVDRDVAIGAGRQIQIGTVADDPVGAPGRDVDGHRGRARSDRRVSGDRSRRGGARPLRDGAGAMDVPMHGDAVP